MSGYAALDITVPRARLSAAGEMKEWRSAVLPRYARMTGQAEARTLGIVHSIHQPEALMPAALAMASRFAHASTAAIGMAKNILNPKSGSWRPSGAEDPGRTQPLVGLGRFEP